MEIGNSGSFSPMIRHGEYDSGEFLSPIENSLENLSLEIVLLAKAALPSASMEAFRLKDSKTSCSPDDYGGPASRDFYSNISDDFIDKWVVADSEFLIEEDLDSPETIWGSEGVGAIGLYCQKIILPS